MFPSLVNCCTIDWFVDWPEEALLSVAHDSLKDIQRPDLIANMATMCYTIHKVNLRYRKTKTDFATPNFGLDIIIGFVIMTSLCVKGASEGLTGRVGGSRFLC